MESRIEMLIYYVRYEVKWNPKFRKNIYVKVSSSGSRKERENSKGEEKLKEKWWWEGVEIYMVEEEMIEVRCEGKNCIRQESKREEKGNRSEMKYGRRKSDG